MSIEICEKHGIAKTVPKCDVSFFKFKPDSPFIKPYCQMCIDEDKARVEEEFRNEEKRKQAEAHKNRFKHLNLGKRFDDATFDTYDTTSREQEIVKRTCQRYAETFSDRFVSGDGMILSGNPGTGKNHLAASIAKSVFDQNRTVLHTTVTRMMREVKESWGKSSEKTEREVVNSFINPDLLIIDEVGIQFGTTAEQVIFMDIINSRYGDMRPTILITMNSLEDVAKILGPQIIDRFREGKSSILKFDWQSHRGNAANR